MLISIHSFRGFWNHATSHIIHQQRYKWPSTYFHNLVGLSLPLHDISLNYVVVSDWLFSKDSTNHLGYDEVFINEIWFAVSSIIYILYLYMSQCILCPSFIIAPEVPRDVFIFFVCPAMCNYFYNQAIYSFSEGRIDRTDRWVWYCCKQHLCLNIYLRLFTIFFQWLTLNIFVFKRSYW